MKLKIGRIKGEDVTFQDRDNGTKRDLTIIRGCTYWSSKGGDVYAVDITRGYCWPVSPRHALESILARKDLQSSVSIVCHHSVEPGVSVSGLKKI